MMVFPIHPNRIGGIVISVLASSAVDRGFEPRSLQAKDYRREQVNFQWDDDEVRFVLEQKAELDFYSATSLKQQFAGRPVAPLGDIILIPSQPIFT
jgi:hypothetical protein